MSLQGGPGERAGQDGGGACRGNCRPETENPGTGAVGGRTPTGAEALRESEERCRILLSESPDPTFSFTPEGRYLFVNQAFAEGVGKPVEAIVGKTIWDVFPKEEADKRFASLSQVFRTGEEKVIEVRVPRADGDRHYLTTISPIKDAQGSVLSAVCSSKDITERKRAEEALEESRERYRALSEAAFEAIFISENGLCIEQNTKAEQMFGYSLAEAVGKFGADWIAPHDRDLVMQHILSGYEQPYEATALRKDGTTFPALICAQDDALPGERRPGHLHARHHRAARRPKRRCGRARSG